MPEGTYQPNTTESKWQEYWVENETYAYDGEQDDDPNLTFAIDTPPPTVSGGLHWGHVYGDTLQDFIARFQRMRGNSVYFPFGYDDNGIASERLTERELGIQRQNFTRQEFQQKCQTVCEQYEATFDEKIQQLGISIDWNQTYQTIEPRVQRLSQLSFLDLYEEGREYRQQAPTIWCPDCETAISQAETEPSEQPASYNDIAFQFAESTDDEILISTTRPELLPACVAIFVHPDDEEHGQFVGEEVMVPLFEHTVPILEDDRVDRETGTGVVMCCTFGDQTDIEWYQAHDLPLRIAIDESGTMTPAAGPYAGLDSDEACDAILADLEDAGHLHDQRTITHTVNVHERCDTSIEFRVTEQWYIKLLDRKEEYLAAGRKIEWYPEKMFSRYKHWIEGLEWDWCISRQRDSGIPFPVWYCRECDQEVMATREQLPVDPLVDEPPVDACPQCGHEEFEPEDDVFDTWATSSLTPLINAGWDGDGFAHQELYPMNVRPQGHDIISFWLFHTIVKCVEHTGEVPFDAVMIHGMILDESGVKMSSSKGNFITPDEVLAEYPVDAARYWAAGTSIGDDFPYREQDLVTGQKLLQKLWNASKLVDQLTPEQPVSVTEGELDTIDRWLLAKLDGVIEAVTTHLQEYEFSKARNELRSFFWNTFCDDYLEITKQRVTDDPLPSATYTLERAHQTFLKLFAPFLAHITEELWMEMYAETSIHASSWPLIGGYDADLEAGETAMEVLSGLRKYKTEHQLALNAELEKVTVAGDVIGFEEVICDAMHVQNLDVVDTIPDLEQSIEIDLNYAKVGPKYGEKLTEIEAALETDAFRLEDGTLMVAGTELESALFDVRRQSRLASGGELIEIDSCVVVVH